MSSKWNLSQEPFEADNTRFSSDSDTWSFPFVAIAFLCGLSATALLAVVIVALTGGGC